MALKIEVYSDVICPWCYLGESRLKQAIESHPKASEIEVHYLPYELNPSTPPEGHDRKEYLHAKYGDRIRMQDIAYRKPRRDRTDLRQKLAPPISHGR